MEVFFLLDNNICSNLHRETPDETGNKSDKMNTKKIVTMAELLRMRRIICHDKVTGPTSKIFSNENK